MQPQAHTVTTRWWYPLVDLGGGALLGAFVALSLWSLTNLVQTRGATFVFALPVLPVIAVPWVTNVLFR